MVEYVSAPCKVMQGRYLDVHFAGSLLLSLPGLHPFHGPCNGVMLLGALILLDLQS